MINKAIRRPLARLLACGLLASVAVTLGPGGSPASAAPPRYEAEQATISNGVVESEHAGFSGSGYVNYDNEVGGYVEWTVEAPAAGPQPLTFRYGNGTAAARETDIQVNGTAAARATFAPSGSWTTWRTETVTVTLRAGANTIRAIGVAAAGGPNMDYLELAGDTSPPPVDWTKEVADSTIQRRPGGPGGWGYTQALFLHATYLLYKRTGDARYLTYIKRWADSNVPASGQMSRSFNNLDSMLGGQVLVDLHLERAGNGDPRYGRAARQIRDRLWRTSNPYPRTSDGGWWHSTSESRRHQLWLDGVFMVLPFLVRYGEAFGEADRAYNEAVNQLNVYFKHLNEPNGLLKHAYDESRTQSWANKTTGKSPEFWCRAMGWFAMTHILVLDELPAGHPGRASLISNVQHMARGFERFQDTRPAPQGTGRWFQVVDKGSNPDNWTETSCSAMYTYMLSRAAELGYVDEHYKAVAARGYQGVLRKVTKGSDGLTSITDISEGTNVGNLAYYLARARNTNDLHGLGAFMIMNEQLRRTGGT